LFREVRRIPPLPGEGNFTREIGASAGLIELPRADQKLK